MSDYKVTIKYFLQTNLKPAILNNVNHYPIYISITVKRRTTKIRSITFNEHYTKDQFKEIHESSEGIIGIKIETLELEKTARLVVAVLGNFDSMFFYTYVGFINILEKVKSNLRKNDILDDSELVLFHLSMKYFKFYLHGNRGTKRLLTKYPILFINNNV